MSTPMLPLSRFGRTGHLSTRVIFGAAALGSMRQDAADRALATMRSLGINHIDTAAGYGDSELRLAPYLAEHRDEVFLATKTDGRSGSSARRDLEASLERMGVESVDLVQLHNLVEPEEWEVAHGPGGALEALLAARDEGLVRFVGVTGHGTRIAGMHLRSLSRHDYDTVLLPYNHTMLSRPDYRPDLDALLDLCAERDVAVQTIKSVARRRWQEGDGPRYAWYEPLPAGEALSRAVAFVLSNPQVFLNSSSDVRLLTAIVEAAANVTGAPSEDDLRRDEDDLAISCLFDGAALDRI